MCVTDPSSTTFYWTKVTSLSNSWTWPRKRWNKTSMISLFLLAIEITVCHVSQFGNTTQGKHYKNSMCFCMLMVDLMSVYLALIFPLILQCVSFDHGQRYLACHQTLTQPVNYESIWKSVWVFININCDWVCTLRSHCKPIAADAHWAKCRNEFHSLVRSSALDLYVKNTVFTLFCMYTAGFHWKEWINQGLAMLLIFLDWTYISCRQDWKHCWSWPFVLVQPMLTPSRMTSSEFVPLWSCVSCTNASAIGL